MEEDVGAKWQSFKPAEELSIQFVAGLVAACTRSPTMYPWVVAEIAAAAS